MFHLNEAFYHEEMPARAKRLFVKTFKKYHKLDGGDEDVALHMAKQAVDREYVKLNNRWIPKTAAEEIVRHDLDDDSLSESESPEQHHHQQQHRHRSSIETSVPFGRGVGKYNRPIVNGNQHRNNNDDDDEDDDDEFLSESDQHQSDDTDEYDYDDDDYRLVRRERNRKSRRGGDGGRGGIVAGGGIEKPVRRSVVNKNNKLAFK